MIKDFFKDIGLSFNGFRVCFIILFIWVMVSFLQLKKIG